MLWFSTVNVILKSDLVDKYDHFYLNSRRGEEILLEEPPHYP